MAGEIRLVSIQMAQKATWLNTNSKQSSSKQSPQNQKESALFYYNSCFWWMENWILFPKQGLVQPGQQVCKTAFQKTDQEVAESGGQERKQQLNGCFPTTL